MVLMLMFLYFQREISELCRPIALKLCHMIGSIFSFIIQVQQFAPPRKNWGPKRAEFGAISDNFRLRSQMSSKRSKILKIGKTAVLRTFGERKFGELWSTNNTVLKVDYHPTKSIFSEDHISATKGCCPIKFAQAC